MIVKNMVLLLNYRARGAPSLGPTPRDGGPLPHSPGVPRPGPPPATCLGPKAVPHASIFPIQPVLIILLYNTNAVFERGFWELNIDAPAHTV